MKLKAIILVFNADWSIAGGLRYLRDRVRGDEPCELCRITYGGLTKKDSWKTCEKDIRAPVEELYKNQLTPEIAAAIDGVFPAVLARTDQGPVRLIAGAELDALDGDPQRLYERLLAELETRAITVGQ